MDILASVVNQLIGAAKNCCAIRVLIYRLHSRINLRRKFSSFLGIGFIPKLLHRGGQGVTIVLDDLECVFELDFQEKDTSGCIAPVNQKVIIAVEPLLCGGGIGIFLELVSGGFLSINILRRTIQLAIGIGYLRDLFGMLSQIVEIVNIDLDVNAACGDLGLIHRSVIDVFGSGQILLRGLQGGFGVGNLLVDHAVLAVNSAVGHVQLGGVLGVYLGGLVGGLFLVGGVLARDRDVLEGLSDLIGDGLLVGLVNQLVDHAVKGVLRVGVGLVGVDHSLGGVGLGLSEGVLVLGLHGGGGVSGCLLGRLFGGGSLVGLGLDGLVDGGLDGFAVFALYFHSQLVLNVMLGFFGVFHGLAGLIQDFAFDNLFCLPGFRIGFLCDNVRGLLAIGGRLRGIQGVIDVIDQLLSAAIGRVDDVGLAGFQYFLREGFFGLGRLGRGQGGGGEEAQGQTGGYQPGQNAFFCHHFILLQINFG